ncbi:MAG: winged helix-turn-helix transcriptional regulator [Oscillospiraceae bacterium]|nr:winged helix-turn-helix transcriptional regulator [Oscillospiraceae bacterium]MDE6131883.1 winged helix-turn-helix transcriptional regulator [Oscillospiraceae bacterium]
MEKNNAGKKLWEYNTIFKENDEIYRNAASDLGLSDCTMWILYALRADGTVTQKDICGAIYYPKQTVNSALKKLESDGCIVLSEMEDRRSKQISLTPKGVKLSEKTADRVIEAELAALSGLTDAEWETFIGIFRKYTKLLKNNMQFHSQ